MRTYMRVSTCIDEIHRRRVTIRAVSCCESAAKFREHGERNNCPVSLERASFRITMYRRTVAFVFVLLLAFYPENMNACKLLAVCNVSSRLLSKLNHSRLWIIITISPEIIYNNL